MKNTSLKKILTQLAMVFTLGAIGVFIYLYKHHIDLKLGTGSTSSVCNISEKLNCDIAASSPYAEIFGLPIALLGAFTSGLLFLFLLLTRYDLTQNTERMERYSFYLSTLIFLVSLVMGGVSLFILKSACPFCIASYVLALFTWITLWIAFRPRLQEFGTDAGALFSTDKWVIWTSLSAPILALIVNGMTLDSYGYRELQRASESSLSSWQNAPVQNFNPQQGLQYQNGTGEAKVTVVEFADFLCSHCRAAYPALHAFAKSHPDVRLIFKNFPLDGACNPAIQHRGDGKSCELSYAAYCAEKISQKGWEAHNYIFDNQVEIYSKAMPQVVEEICKISGGDCEQLKSCMNSEETHTAIKNMAAEGEKAQISGTPSVFLNGKNLPSGQFLPILENAYRRLQ